MGARWSAGRRITQQTTHPPPLPPTHTYPAHPPFPPAHHPSTPTHPPTSAPPTPSPFPPRTAAVATDFARWQQAQQKRQEVEHSITQRMLDEQRKAPQQEQKVENL